MGAVTLALVGFFAFVIARVSQPAMGVLFSELSASDASAISRDLDARGVRYESRDEGQTILVPRADLARLRMDLAGKGMPSGGGVGYEIFDKGDAFSSTSFVQNMNHLRALEGELARSIRTLARVQAARVHLALPERRLFERDREAARASIVLKLRGEIGADQVQAIRHLVASGVEGLTPERVSVVDERGRLLADGAGTGGPGMAVVAATDKRVALERRLRTQVEELVAGIVGGGRSRVQVSAELDLNRVESRSEAFDPESRVVRSTQTRGETATTTNGEGQVTVGNELPGAQANAQPPANAPRDNSNKTEEVINYEISRTTRTEVQEAGRVKRLSVAVLVDGVYARAPNGGEPAYQARSKEDLDRIAALVRSAVGFDAARGDQVEVVNLPFADAPLGFEAEKTPLLGSLFSPSRHDMMRFAEIGVIALLTLIVLLVVVRPMVKRMLAPDGLMAEGARSIAGPGDGLAIGPGAGAAAVTAGLPSLSVGRAGHGEAAEPNQIARLGELARSNPRQAAAVLRGWMAES
jgi:flagellar M-ring protein FliF